MKECICPPARYGAGREVVTECPVHGLLLDGIEPARPLGMRPTMNIPSLGHLEEGQIVVINGDRYEIIDLHEGRKYEYQMTVRYRGEYQGEA